MKSLFILAAFLLAVSGCQSTADKTAFGQLNGMWGSLAPRFTTYIQADAAISTDLKAELLKDADQMTKLLAEKAKG